MSDKHIKFIFLWLLVPVSFIVKAQPEGFHYGGRFGLGVSQMINTGYGDTQGKLLVSGGVSANYQFIENFGLTADFLITSKGDEMTGTTTEQGTFGSTDYDFEQKFSLIYAEVPLMVKGSIGLGDFFIKGFGGPSMNFNLIGAESRTYDDSEYNQENGYSGRDVKNLETMEFSFVYGAGVEVVTDAEKIYMLDFRMSNGLTPIIDNTEREVKTNYFALSAGYMF